MTYSIINKTKEVNLNRISRHPLENYFGQIRTICRDFDSYENFLICSTQAFFNIIFKNELNISQKIKKRINVAGICIDEDSGWLNFDQTKCTEMDILVRMLHHSNITIKTPYSTEIEQSFNNFIQFLIEVDSQDIQFSNDIYSPSIFANSDIKERCIKVNLLKEPENSLVRQDEKTELYGFLIQSKDEQ